MSKKKDLKIILTAASVVEFSIRFRKIKFIEK